METNNSTSSHENHGCAIPTSMAYALITVNSLASLLGTFANVLVCVAVFKNSRLQTLTNYFLLSLALADMLVTGITQPLFVVRNISFTLQDDCVAPTSTAYKLSAYFSCMASILSLTAVSIDRLISLKYPLQKKTMLPKRRGFLLIAATWLLALSYMAASFFLGESKAWVMTTFVYFGLCYLTMIVTHSYMYVVSHRFVQRRNLHTRRYSFSMVSYAKERQAAKTVTIIIAVFTVAWLPYCFGLGFAATSDWVLKRTLGYPLLTVGLINSSINPLLYSWRNKDFRTTFRQLLKCQDPNLLRRESVSSFYLSRSRISTVSSLFSECNNLNGNTWTKSTQVVTTKSPDC